MTKYTNKLGLPKPVVDAVVNDNYTKGNADVSITTLLKPPRIRVLAKKHRHEIVEDVSEHIYNLLGQTMHGILEHAGTSVLRRFKTAAEELLASKVLPDLAQSLVSTLLTQVLLLIPDDSYARVEERFYLDVTVNEQKITVSGGLDAYYESGLIQDYKLVSVYKVKDGVPLEYEQQLNCYAVLLRHAGLTVNALQLVCILRDWSKGAAKRRTQMPQNQVVMLDVPLWAPETAMAFLQERVRIHLDANTTLPECTPEERWATDDKFAVIEKGKKRATRLYDDRLSAESHAAKLKDAVVQPRPGESKRCADWCAVSQWCDQWKQIQKENK